MPTVTKQFVLAGKATFTVELADSFRQERKEKYGEDLKAHYTFRVNFKAKNGKYPDTYFVKVLTGPENTKDYTYVGKLLKDSGKVVTTSASKWRDDDIRFKLLNRVLALVWLGDIKPIEEKGFGLHHEGKCGRCGRLLTTPESIERGIGPECWEIMGGSVKVKGWEAQEDAEPDDEPDPSREAEDRALSHAYGQGLNNLLYGNGSHYSEGY